MTAAHQCAHLAGLLDTVLVWVHDLQPLLDRVPGDIRSVLCKSIGSAVDRVSRGLYKLAEDLNKADQES